jgi:hypothetical protein
VNDYVDGGAESRHAIAQAHTYMTRQWCVFCARVSARICTYAYIHTHTYIHVRVCTCDTSTHQTDTPKSDTHMRTQQVTASMDARILVWDLTLFTLRRTLNAGQNKGVYFLAYIPSQRYLISASFDHHCKVCMCKDQSFKHSYQAHTCVAHRDRFRIGADPHGLLARSHLKNK